MRNLEREIGSICRKAARKVVESGKRSASYRVTAGNLESYLGKKKTSYDIVEGGSEVGVTTGMAWTAVGGDTLFIETTVMKGSRKAGSDRSARRCDAGVGKGRPVGDKDEK